MVGKKKYVFVVLGLILSTYIAWEITPSSKISTNQCDVGKFQINHQIVSDLRCVDRLNVVYAAKDGTLFGIEDHFIYRSDDGGKTFFELGVLPKIDPTFIGQIKNRIARSKLVRHVRKYPGPINIVVLDSGTILVFYDYVYKSDNGGKSFTVVWDYKLPDQSVTAPFPFEGIAVGSNDEVFFGEYDTSARPHAVSIIKGSQDGRIWEEVYRFPIGEIFHIHSIQYDKFRNGYWVATGDNDSESALYFADDSFRSLRKVGGGNQDWRIVSLVIQEEALYWGSDDDRNGGGLFKLSLTDDNQLVRLGALSNVSYFSTVTDNNVLAISTTYEPESMATNRALTTNDVAIFMSEDGADWVKILSVESIQHDTAFGKSRGSIAFPAGFPSRRLWFVTNSTEAKGLVSYSIRLTPANQ